VSDFFATLAARVHEATVVVRPRVPSRFESAGNGAAPHHEPDTAAFADETTQAPARRPSPQSPAPHETGLADDMRREGRRAQPPGTPDAVAAAPSPFDDTAAFAPSAARNGARTGDDARAADDGRAAGEATERARLRAEATPLARANAAASAAVVPIAQQPQPAPTAAAGTSPAPAIAGPARTELDTSAQLRERAHIPAAPTPRDDTREPHRTHSVEPAPAAQRPAPSRRGVTAGERDGHVSAPPRAVAATVTPLPAISTVRPPHAAAIVPRAVRAAPERAPARANVPPAETTVHVSIGRIEVRATPAAPERRREPAPPPVMSLGEYLSSRAERARR
jgi:hypothetical protein